MVSRTNFIDIDSGALGGAQRDRGSGSSEELAA
jgi:hypothetical protein